MKSKLLKSKDGLFAFVENYPLVPVIGTSEKEVKEKLVSEVYRTAAFLEKKLPENPDTVEFSEVADVSCSVKNESAELFGYVADGKKSREICRSLYVQTLFTFKCLADGANLTSAYYDKAIDIIKNTVKSVCFYENGGFMETGFAALGAIDDDGASDIVKDYCEIMKTVYLLTGFARELTEDGKAENLFMFGV